MDLNSLILDYSISEYGVCNPVLKQGQFIVIQALDQEHIHISEPFKTLCITKISDHLVNVCKLDKNNILYTFVTRGDNFIFHGFSFTKLTVEQRHEIAELLPSPDIDLILDISTINNRGTVTKKNANNKNIYEVRCTLKQLSNG